MKNWDFCMGCMALWMRNLRSSTKEFFLGNWLKEDLEGIEKRKETEKKFREEESRCVKREVEREEEKTVVVKRRCVTPLSSDVLRNFVPWKIREVSRRP